MARDLTTAFKAALEAEVVYPVFLYEAEFDPGESEDGWVYLWTGRGDKVWDGKTYQGIGWIIGFSNITETAEIKAAAVTVSLRGVDTAVTSIALQSLRQGKPGIMRLALLEDDGSIIADPDLTFEGRLDVGEISEQAKTAIVNLRYESRLIDLERSGVRRFTHEDQQIDYPGDRAFEHVGTIQDREVIWGPS